LFHAAVVILLIILLLIDSLVKLFPSAKFAFFFEINKSVFLNKNYA